MRAIKHKQPLDSVSTSQKFDPQIIYSSIEQQNFMRASQQTQPTIFNVERERCMNEEIVQMERTYTESTQRDHNAMHSTNKSLRMFTQQSQVAQSKIVSQPDATKKHLHFTSIKTVANNNPPSDYLPDEQTQNKSFLEQQNTAGAVDRTMITHDLAQGRSDYNDSFVRYLQSAAPQLIHETSDISCVSNNNNIINGTTLKHKNIAEELNNYDVVQPHKRLVSTKRNLSSTPHLDQSVGVLLDPANSQMTARFSQYQT